MAERSNRQEAMLSIDHVAGRLADHSPGRILGRSLLRCCGVAVVLREGRDAGPSVLLIRRAQREGDPWSGQMGLPGGRMEVQDADVLATAVRETYEETGLALARDACVGRLSDVLARPVPMIITPYVFRLDREPAWRPNWEVDEIVWVPLALFDHLNRRQMDWRFLGVDWRMPCYFFEGRRIWGLTLMMLDELLEVIGAD